MQTVVSSVGREQREDREPRGVRRFIEDRTVVLFSVYRRRRDRLSAANASKSFHREITLRWLCHYPFETPSMEWHTR